ncbi:helix-turn-helix transcriptional regulator [Pusillimonas sp. TS35]|uniref:response regulator transcription factor n=1 Tax=Paracandidimonas lactea TaxID=2895524 RepID=UPI0013717A1F|nr:helix-turn-helix transcriptional regulator [Paracandidimonas lactea]MYN12940.1 helix-turn-helix transcriptional regulator [Pusillimonas sp. TS35]
MNPSHQPSLLPRLTPREREVMAYVARGELNKIIAAELGVSRRTIETHRARIFQKMQVRNAVQLTRRILGEPPKG